jgi:hypothetical protein
MKHENWYNEEYMSAKRHEVVEKASSLIKRSIDFLAGVRDLKNLKYEVSDDDFDPDFMLFVAIDTETDHIPVGKLRDSCSVSWLEKCDNEIEKVKEFYHKQLVKACEKLISRFTVDA